MMVILQNKYVYGLVGRAIRTPHLLLDETSTEIVAALKHFCHRLGNAYEYELYEAQPETQFMPS